MWLGETPTPVFPSPKSQVRDTMLPSGSTESELSNDTSRLAGVQLNAAVGATFGTGATKTSWVIESLSPSSSVTVRVTGYVPCAA